MEELLNKLIEKGWKPFGIEGIKEFHLKTYECERGTNKIRIKHFEGYFTDGIKTSDYPTDYGSRMYVVYGLKHITAKESGLWQFVCENGMVKKNRMYFSYGNTITTREVIYKYDNVVFWILESSMTSEDGLEQFLLDNIKIDE